MTDDIKLDISVANLERKVATLETQIVELAHAIDYINRYSHRLPAVTAACSKILDPSSEIGDALEAEAQLMAARSTIGKITSITAEWDHRWTFIFTFRGTAGYSAISGFDLRPGTAGLRRLLESLVRLDVESSSLDLTAPEECQPGALQRRLVYVETY